jgi:hypothetical protein
MLESSTSANRLFQPGFPGAFLQENSERFQGLIDAASADPATPAALRGLEASADFLELVLVAAAVQEAALLAGVTGIVELERAQALIARSAQAISGLDVKGTLERHSMIAASGARLLASGLDDNVLPDLPATVARMARVAAALVEACPILDLERAAEVHARPEAGHRCRVAYDRLAAFALRHDARAGVQVKSAGHAYMEGRLSIDEVASLVGRPVPDAVTLLEHLGYSRPPDVVMLTEDARREALSKLAYDRKERQGRPRSSPELVDRDVVATQRIEGVDARPWLPPAKA